MNRSANRFVLAAMLAIFLSAGLYLSWNPTGGEFFMPHAHCYLFNHHLMLLHGGSDLAIGLSYVAISAGLIWLVVRARKELPFHWIMIAFAIFIVACGATHFMELWTLTAPHPMYWLAGWVKLITAVASVTTAVVLPPLIPRVLEMLTAARRSAEHGDKLQRAYAELNFAHARVKQLDQLKTNFFANVSHELRTPLALIFGPIERLLAEIRDEGARRELAVVRRNALLLHKYVNDLLDVSKLEVGKMELHYSRLDVATMARTVAGMFESMVSERGIAVAVKATGEAMAEVDGDKLQRVFMNLLSNAFKYAPDGSTVRLTLTGDDDHLTLTVEDAGPGVPVDLRKEIFERFQQGDRETQRRYGGTGLGLSIVKEFVEMHRGSIVAGESSLGGALFRVQLPRHAPSGTEVGSSPWSEADTVIQRLAHTPVVERTAETPRSAGIQDGLRADILVVEDNRDMRDFICRVLEPDAETRAVENGRVALEAMTERIPDLVLTDMMMPEMTGDELLTELRSSERLRDVPVVMLTAKADDDLKFNLLQDGAQDYVMKPFSVAELRARVRNQLQTKRARDVLQRTLDTRSQDLAAMVSELARARSVAESANSAKDSFLAVLSHELRTPLTPALAATSALISAPPSDPEVLREFLAVIRRNIELEARLVDDLLDVTRINRDKLRIQPTTVDLHSILRDALSMAAPVLREKEIATVADLMAEGPAIHGDAARLAQVFSNLLTNAAKFTPESGQVTLRSEVVGSMVRVMVKDTGIGISGEVLPHIFEPFRQGEAAKARRFGGLGLGLSIAKGLVEAHGGTIRAYSDGPGQGAVFTVELPVLSPDAVHAEATPSTSNPAAMVRTLHVLLVEDHEDTRRILTRLISFWGHTLTVAISVAEACQALDAEKFDLVLSDIGLPDGSGFDVVAKLRKISTIPAVAMSGYGMESDLARTQAAGFNEHLVKPVSAEALREVLARLGSQGESV
ncbi:ATP-binding protein [Chthoniobacter flavus]|nr:ATP-binding protein [Chthoniobacter flavus]